MKLKTWFLFSLVYASFATFNAAVAFDDYIVLGEGRATSYVAEHVVLNQARLRMVNSARVQCREAGFASDPELVSGSGYCQASYKNRVWYASCTSEFICH